MRATDGLQTTITLGPVKDDGQAFALEMSLGMSLPVPPQDEHLPDQIEVCVHHVGLEVQRRGQPGERLRRGAKRGGRDLHTLRGLLLLHALALAHIYGAEWEKQGAVYRLRMMPHL